MIQKIKAFIKQSEMLKKGDRIVLGVSGGADSICLLHVLFSLQQEYCLSLFVVHVNHGIRGEEADRDERFVKELCEQKGIEFHSFYYDVKKHAKIEGLSEEEAGRKLRYEAFLDTCRNNRCNKLAIAHNKNDNAETLLFHLFRGSGIKGLSGIEASRRLRLAETEVILIRPLLCVTREEIEAYLKQEGIHYLIDSTNLSDAYTRNKIRNRVLTYAVKEINPQSVTNITEAARCLKEIDDYVTSNILRRFEELVHKEDGGYHILVEELINEPAVIQKGMLRLILTQLAGCSKDLEAKHVEAVLALTAKQVGRQVHLPYHIIAERGYEAIYLNQKTVSGEQEHPNRGMKPILAVIPGNTEIIQKRKILESKLINYKKNDTIPKSSCAKWFDYDKIENAVEIRTRRVGDFLQINASGGNKKLKDYFIDLKLPKKQRDEQLLITDGSHVMWIPGTADRMSEKYKVDDTTSKVLLMKLIDLED